MKRENGGVLLLLLALIAVLGILGALAARQIVPARRETRRAYQRAVLRNLAEGAIVAGLTQLRRGQALVARVFGGERFGALEGSATLRLPLTTIAPLPNATPANATPPNATPARHAARRELVAEARLAGPGAERRPYVIRVQLTRGSAGDWQILDWREHFAPRQK